MSNKRKCKLCGKVFPLSAYRYGGKYRISYCRYCEEEYNRRLRERRRRRQKTRGLADDMRGGQVNRLA